MSLIRTFYAVGPMLLCVAGCSSAQGTINAVTAQPPATQLPNEQYVLGPGDSFSIIVTDAKELADQFANDFLINSDGYVNIPLVGRLRAEGLAVPQFEQRVIESLRRYIHEPQAYVIVRAPKSKPVSVLGAVNSPGVHQLDGPKRLAEVLALAGGVSKEAGYRVTVARRRKWGELPLPGAALDASGEYYVAEVNTRAMTEGNNPQYNILIQPDDLITVPRAQVVYVIGEVKKAGGFTLGDEKSMSLLQALSLAEGTTRTAVPSHAKILRPVPDSTSRTEIQVNLKKVLAGKASDVVLSANDILYVPDSSAKRAGIRVAESAVQTISGLIIWRGL